MIRTLSLAAVLIAAGTAAAQRPVPTVSPPILNPQVQQYIAPRVTRYVPPRYTPPTVGYNPWVGPIVFPGTYRPPRVVQSVPGTYLNVAGLGLYNPWTGAIYSPYTHAFFRQSGKPLRIFLVAFTGSNASGSKGPVPDRRPAAQHPAGSHGGGAGNAERLLSRHPAAQR